MENETSYSTALSGTLNVKFNEDLDLFCRENIPGYDPLFYQAIVIRFFSGKENILTVYAIDKVRQESNGKSGFLHVKKFKIPNITPEKLFQLFSEYNFTLSSGKSNIEKMIVVNK